MEIVRYCYYKTFLCAFSPTKDLQGNSVTFSCILPSLAGLDKTLASSVTNYTHFTKALRTGLHTHCQSLMVQKDVILATVLDPRIKLQVLTVDTRVTVLLSCHARVPFQTEG